MDLLQTSLEQSCLMLQLMEPILLLGKEKFAGVDIRIRVKGGGRISQIYGANWDLDSKRIKNYIMWLVYIDNR